MQSKYLILVFGIVLIFACNKEDDHFDLMPESDVLALEGMSDAYEASLRYNDSLTICTNEPSGCDSTTLFHYDDMFHQFDDQFNFHHNAYSHNNENDDHHHKSGQSVWHGNMMGHGNSHNDDHGDYDHNNETLEDMVHLRELHDDIHPH
jgi:hypothetical protein